MTAPPANDAPSPKRETPPFVPGGTVLPDRMKKGGEEERMPSSDARVSARQVEKWLSWSARMNSLDREGGRTRTLRPCISMDELIR